MTRARKAVIVGRAEMPEYESEAAAALHRLANVGEMIANGLFAVAAGMHTETTGDQRNMTGVFVADARNRYADVLRKLDPKTEQELNTFIDNLCKGKSKR